LIQGLNDAIEHISYVIEIITTIKENAIANNNYKKCYTLHLQ